MSTVIFVTLGYDLRRTILQPLGTTIAVRYDQYDINHCTK